MKIKNIKTLEQWIKKSGLGYTKAASVFRMTRQNLWNIRNDKVTADWHTLNALAFAWDYKNGRLIGGCKDGRCN